MYYDNFDKLNNDIHIALRAWGDLTGTPENLLEGLLLVREKRSTISLKSPASLRLITNQVLHNALDELRVQNRQGANILQSRFLDGDTILMAAHKLNLSSDQIKRYQKKAIEHLTNIIFDKELELRKEQLTQLETKLSLPTYKQLFGVESTYKKLVTQLNLFTAPWIFVITGIGGIGKTALADAVVRQVMSYFHYDDIIWLRVNPPAIREHNKAPNLTIDGLVEKLSTTLLPDLPSNISIKKRYIEIARILKTRPYLIVIDNLEIEADTAYLLAHLGDWANPSKFLLTARSRPMSQITVEHVSLTELSFDDTEQLILHHINHVGLANLNVLNKDDSQAIYQVTGGNPLAVKLVIGLATVLPLEQVLHDLKDARSNKVEQMYLHIYWKAWQSLSMSGKALLEMMVIASNVGVEPEMMQKMSGLSNEQLWPAISELVNRSLLEVHGTIRKRRYSIHRLTETFLHTEIIHWPKGHV